MIAAFTCFYAEIRVSCTNSQSKSSWLGYNEIIHTKRNQDQYINLRMDLLMWECCKRKVVLHSTGYQCLSLLVIMITIWSDHTWGLFSNSESTNFEFQLKTSHPAQWLGAAAWSLVMFSDAWWCCRRGALAVDFVGVELATEPPLGLRCTAAESETIHPGKEFRAISIPYPYHVTFYILYIIYIWLYMLRSCLCYQQRLGLMSHVLDIVKQCTANLKHIFLDKLATRRHGRCATQNGAWKRRCSGKTSKRLRLTENCFSRSSDH